MMRPLATCVFVLVGCIDPKPSTYPSHQVVYTEDGTAGPSDLLDIHVVDNTELSGTFEIDTNGEFSFPYIGVVKSDGKTAAQIETEIRDRLADGFLRDPQVVVRIKEHRSKKIAVFGEVRKGTIIPFADGMTIIEAIAEAGGFTPRAWENAVKVTRKSSARVEEFTVPVQVIANGKAPNFYMRPGDSVFVPKSPM